MNWKTLNEEKPSVNHKLLVRSPEGDFHLTSYRPAYDIFTCNGKWDNAGDWEWVYLKDLHPEHNDPKPEDYTYKVVAVYTNDEGGVEQDIRLVTVKQLEYSKEGAMNLINEELRKIYGDSYYGFEWVVGRLLGAIE